MKALPMLSHAVRFDRNSPDFVRLSSGRANLRNRQTIRAFQSVSDHQYWCVYTQTCIGPDNGLVEPYRVLERSTAPVIATPSERNQ